MPPLLKVDRGSQLQVIVRGYRNVCFVEVALPLNHSRGWHARGGCHASKLSRSRNEQKSHCSTAARLSINRVTCPSRTISLYLELRAEADAVELPGLGNITKTARVQCPCRGILTQLTSFQRFSLPSAGDFLATTIMPE